MEQLLRDIVARLTTELGYLNWVGVVDDELLPPPGVAPPFVGVKDNGLRATALPGQLDDERLSVVVIAYQALQIGEPGAAILGSTGNLGEAGKGLLAIADDIKAALNDYCFAGFQKAYRDALLPSQVIEREGDLLSRQGNVFTYWRIV